MRRDFFVALTRFGLRPSVRFFDQALLSLSYLIILLRPTLPLIVAKGIHRGLARPLFSLSSNGKQSTLTIYFYEGGCYGSKVSFRIRKMATMKQTRRTTPIISFIMVSSGCDRGMMA